MKNRSGVCLVLFSTLLMLADSTGCRRGSDKTKIAARFGDKTISVDDLDAKVVAEIFELRSTALHGLLVEKLIDDEAGKRGVTVAQLWRLEVEGKVPMPEEQEAIKALDDWVSGGRLTAEEGAQMSPGQAAERLRRMRLHEREEAYYEDLFRKAAVQVDFGALGKPWLKMANDGPSLGPSDAKLTVVEFADLTQSFTSIWQPTLEQLVDKYGSKVRFVFKQKPSAPEAPSGQVAEAVLCANQQGKYWDFRKALFQAKSPIKPESVAPAAEKARLDIQAFNDCIASRKTKAIVAQNLTEARSNGLEGEPVVSINGIRLSGAHPFSTVDRLLRLEMHVN